MCHNRSSCGSLFIGGGSGFIISLSGCVAGLRLMTVILSKAGGRQKIGVQSCRLAWLTGRPWACDRHLCLQL